MVIQRIIQKHTQLLTMTGGGNCELLLSELADYAIKQGLAKPGFTESLLEREQNFPTGIQAASGIAIPHSEQEFTIKPALIIAVLDQGTWFHPMGGGKDVLVETIFLLLLEQAEQQVEMLSNIVSFIQDKEKLKALRSKEDAFSTVTSFEKLNTSDKAR